MWLAAEQFPHGGSGLEPHTGAGSLGFGGESCFCDSRAASQGLGPFLIIFLNSKGKRLLLLGKAAEEGKCTARKQSYFFLDSKQLPSKPPKRHSVSVDGKLRKLNVMKVIGFVQASSDACLRK